MSINSKTYEFVEDEVVMATKAFSLGCDICGELLEWEAKMVYDTETDRQVLNLTAKSCGETFLLEPIEFMMKKKKLTTVSDLINED